MFKVNEKRKIKSARPHYWPCSGLQTRCPILPSTGNCPLHTSCVPTLRADWPQLHRSVGPTPTSPGNPEVCPPYHTHPTHKHLTPHLHPTAQPFSSSKMPSGHCPLLQASSSLGSAGLLSRFLVLLFSGNLGVAPPPFLSSHLLGVSTWKAPEATVCWRLQSSP